MGLSSDTPIVPNTVTWVEDFAGPISRRTLGHHRKHRAQGIAKKVHPTPQPCEVCGKSGKTQRHHWDYDKPEEIEWLCAKHHWEADDTRLLLECIDNLGIEFQSKVEAMHHKKKEL